MFIQNQNDENIFCQFTCKVRTNKKSKIYEACQITLTVIPILNFSMITYSMNLKKFTVERFLFKDTIFFMLLYLNRIFMLTNTIELSHCHANTSTNTITKIFFELIQ